MKDKIMELKIWVKTQTPGQKNKQTKNNDVMKKKWLLGKAKQENNNTVHRV